MERRLFIRQAGIAGVLAAGAAPAVVHAQANLRWRLASSFPKSLDTIFGGGEVFARKVSELSGGKFQISVHAGGELMPAFGVVDGVQNGTVEMAHTVPYYFFGKDETFAIGASIPFGLNSRQMTAWMMEGNGLKLMREFYAGYNTNPTKSRESKPVKSWTLEQGDETRRGGGGPEVGRAGAGSGSTP
jgi:TRAP-type mannitol/chloroaromatic compound transport system substrate-binding protein